MTEHVTFTEVLVFLICDIAELLFSLVELLREVSDHLRRLVQCDIRVIRIGGDIAVLLLVVLGFKLIAKLSYYDE